MGSMLIEKIGEELNMSEEARRQLLGPPPPLTFSLPIGRSLGEGKSRPNCPAWA